MTNYAIPLWDTPTIPVVDDNPFPVHRIFCVGRNMAHAREMGHNPDREPPFFFAKPANAVVLNRIRQCLIPMKQATCIRRLKWSSRSKKAAIGFRRE